MKPLKKLENMKDKFKNNDFFKDDNEDEKDKKRIIIYIIIIVILLLLLITSCTSGFLGKIGNIFRNEGNYTIDKDKGKDKEEILNQNLKFDGDSYEVSLSDNNLKIGFSYEGIYPTTYTCVTSEANIATCYVSDGYVVVNPKAVGEVNVYLQTIVNDKVYKASTKVNIIDSIRKIEFTNEAGTIYLGTNKNKNVAFRLIGLVGDVEAFSSDEDVAKVSIENGLLKITGGKPGVATITLTLTYNGKTYEASYKINVQEGKNPYLGSIDSKPGSSGTTTPSTPDTPSNPSNPSVEESKSVSTLRSLISNRGTLTKVGNEYTLGVKGYINSVTLTPTLSHPGATMVCSYKKANESVYRNVDCKKALDVEVGDNIVKIVVTSEDKTSTTEYVVRINRANHNYLNGIYLDNTLISGFDTEKLTYDNITVPYEVTSLPFRVDAPKNATVSYVYNGGTPTSTLNSLNDLQIGPNPVDIYVTHNGDIRIYTVIVDRARPTVVDTNAYLDNVTITTNTGVLDSFVFNPRTFSYNIDASYEVKTLHFEATPSSSSNSVEIYYNGTLATDKKADIPLDVGPNEITIKVLNNGGEETYTFNINRAAEENKNTLSNLTIDGVQVDGFAWNKKEYEYSVLEDGPSEVVIKGIVEDPSRATITYVGDNVDENGKVTLQPGYNVVTVRVIDNKTNVPNDYQVRIYKESSTLSNDANVESITVTLPDGTTVLPKENTYEYEVENDVNNVTVLVKPTHEKATVTYNGKDLGTIDLLTNVTEVQVVVTAEDQKTQNTFTVKIIRKEAEKPELPTIEGKIQVTNDKDAEFDQNNEATVKVDKEELVNLTPINIDGVTVTYTYNGVNYTTASDANDAINANIHNGKNDVVITLKKGEVTNTYTLHLIKDNSYLTEDSSIIDGTLISDLLKDGAYKVVAYNISDLKLNLNTIDPSYSTITYCLNCNSTETFTNTISISDLQPYENALNIKVSSKDETVERIFTISIVKPERIIEMGDTSICYIEDPECIVNFKVKETLDGTNYQDVEDENVIISPNNVADIVGFTEKVGELSVHVPTTIQDVTFTLGLENYNENLKTHTVSFKIHEDYELRTDASSYDIVVHPDYDGNNNQGSHTFILYSQKRALFTSDVDAFLRDNVLNIVEKNGTNKIEVIPSGDVTVEFDRDAEGFGITSLPIKVTSKGGTGSVQITAYVDGKVVNTHKVDFTITQNYVIHLNANGGDFGTLTTDNTRKTYIRGYNEILDLDTIAKPVFINPDTLDTCGETHYPFKGYAKDANATGVDFTTGFRADYYEDSTHALPNNYVINLYAVYDKRAEAEESTDNVIYDTMWVTPDFFTKKQDGSPREEGNLIYPGALGYYTMKLYNESDKDIKIVGFTLTEDTVCVTNGCLNMGYVIKHNISNTPTYYFGSNQLNGNTYIDDDYGFLNNNKNFQYQKTNTKEVKVTDNLIIPAGTMENGNDGVPVEFAWKWVDHASDTAIGIEANKSNAERITDIYSIRIGIHYKVVNSCNPTN